MTQTNILAIIFLLLPLSFGISKTIREMSRTKELSNYVNLFRKIFIKYVTSNGEDNSSYIWLTKNSNKMQNNLGRQGIVTFKQAFDQGIITNYSLIINGITQVRTYFEQPYLGNLAIQTSQVIDDSLIRKIGDFEEQSEILSSKKFNPIELYRKGWKEIIFFPVTLVGWLGLISIQSVENYSQSLLLKFISGIFAILGLLGSIITIVTGYKQFLEIFHKL
ncbi:hypothetical protein [Leptospira levettii]|uniref:Uncharacterized protein n=1 Tax=Leptospira levettii TaxID=2023178 RepID=A0AAW5V802_9LEPT|nr:hypothetical protein [Leptospira levettii]MCW7467878.1 hypothetical protein [Leptospira levettii]MCW7513479.1 hypothetical protein [Leptospira levettii]MCW7517222.1 hypothetical protein [Leptospira levettii]